jgi:hypothetical protein
MSLAYNEASFLLVKVLQVFDRFTLAQGEVAPLDCQPPAEWKTRKGRQSFEKFYPALILALGAKVISFHLSSMSIPLTRPSTWFVGWYVDAHAPRRDQIAEVVDTRSPSFGANASINRPPSYLGRGFCASLFIPLICFANLGHSSRSTSHHLPVPCSVSPLLSSRHVTLRIRGRRLLWPVINVTTRTIGLFKHLVACSRMSDVELEIVDD